MIAMTTSSSISVKPLRRREENFIRRISAEMITERVCTAGVWPRHILGKKAMSLRMFRCCHGLCGSGCLRAAALDCRTRVRCGQLSPVCKSPSQHESVTTGAHSPDPKLYCPGAVRQLLIVETDASAEMHSDPQCVRNRFPRRIRFERRSFLRSRTTGSHAEVPRPQPTASPRSCSVAHSWCIRPLKNLVRTEILRIWWTVRFVSQCGQSPAASGGAVSRRPKIVSRPMCMCGRCVRPLSCRRDRPTSRTGRSDDTGVSGGPDRLSKALRSRSSGNPIPS
jgi:hypothetical protein